MAIVGNRNMRRCIERYCDDAGWDVVCRKKASGYSLYWRDGAPFVHFRKSGHADEVEILIWDEELQRWRQACDDGASMPIAAALQYVARDPDGVFFVDDECDDDDQDDDGDDTDEEDAPDEGRYTSLADAVIQHLHTSLVTAPLRTHAHATVASVVAAMIGAAIGGTLAGGVIAMLTCLAFLALLQWRRRNVLRAHFLGLPLFSGVAGAIGATVTEGLGGGIWAASAGAGTAFVCATFLSVMSGLAGLLGALAGMIMAVHWFDSLQPHFWSVALTVAAAIVAGKVLNACSQRYARCVDPLMERYARMKNNRASSKKGYTATGTAFRSSSS